MKIKAQFLNHVVQIAAYTNSGTCTSSTLPCSTTTNKNKDFYAVNNIIILLHLNPWKPSSDVHKIKRVDQSLSR